MTSPSHRLRFTATPAAGRADRVFKLGTGVFGLGVVAVLALLVVQLVASSSLAWQRFGLDFVTGQTWDPVANVYGALPYIAGTILSALIALIIPTPIALLTAIYLAALAPRRLAAP